MHLHPYFWTYRGVGEKGHQMTARGKISLLIDGLPEFRSTVFLSRRGYGLSHGRARTTAGASRIRMVTGPGPVAKADPENLVSTVWNKIFKIRNKIFKIIKIGRGHRP